MSPTRSRLTRSARPRLTALLEGAVVGQVYQMGNGRLAFRYDDTWIRDSAAYPISLSMPSTAVEHGDRAIRSYLWGLLPDNPDVLAWWARRYGVSRYRAVELLAHVGEDCAGAVQFAIPSRVDHLVGMATIADEESSVSWLTLYQAASGRWGVPMGRMPTNRILKPPTLGLEDFAYNEHFCLLLARELGLPAAISRVEIFGSEMAIVTERYDRGGPGIEVMADTVRAYSTKPEEDLGRLIDSIALNWLIAGTDAHAKNYSILHTRGPELRLAPLYDVITVLPYPTLTHGRNTLAMAVAGERLISAINGSHWRLLARRVGLNPDRTVARIAALASAIPPAIGSILEREKDKHTIDVIAALGAQVRTHALGCVARLQDSRRARPTGKIGSA